MKKLFNRIAGWFERKKNIRVWSVTRTQWPYPTGFGTVFKIRGGIRTLVHSGLSYEEARRIVEEENEKERNR